MMITPTLSRSLREPTRLIAIAAVASAVLITGCANQPEMGDRTKGTATGAAIGAVSGAILAKVTGNDVGTTAVVGGVVGAAAGNLWSKRMQDKQAEMEKATAGTGIDISRTPQNELKVNVPADFSFDVGRSAVKPDMHPVLDKFAQGLASNMLVRVVGHTDNTGSDAVNNPLSLHRAEAVRSYLGTKGVASSRVQVEGMGEKQPVADNSSAAGRAQNRRVEIFLREPSAN